MGTIGRSQGLDSIVRAAALVKDRGIELEVRVIGFGADLARLRALNESLGAPVDLRGPVDAREVFEHYAWSDTTVVSLRAWEPFEWTVPSKLYELMATGKHVTAVVAGEAADLVREADCGDVLSPGDVEGIAALWERLAADRTLVESRESGREWIARHADYEIVARRYEAVLRSALASEAADGA